MSEAASELKWISSLLRDIGVSLPVTPILYCDNLSAVYLTANPAFHSKTKHFDTDHHYVRERVALGALVVKHIPSYHQIADTFTKSLPQQAFCQLRFKLGVATPPTQSLRGDIKRNKAEVPKQYWKAKTPIQSEALQKQGKTNTLNQTESLQHSASDQVQTLQRSSALPNDDKTTATQKRCSTMVNVQTKNRFDALPATTE